ncbi:MAG: MobA/MobL family protein [Rickettsiaceae bacterium]|nr:MobA/MobL family protein [Rickettsiaceae bacterium]MDD9338030.1 MobA/MobL family protein [Rickettsiaceae bacterium]
MAIQFARIEIVGRSSGGNSCCKAAYNARMIIKDEQTNIIYNFAHKGDNVYHTVLLPDYVDTKFKDPKILMNEVERLERRKNSQLLKDIVVALPDDKELDLS